MTLKTCWRASIALLLVGCADASDAPLSIDELRRSETFSLTDRVGHPPFAEITSIVKLEGGRVLILDAVDPFIHLYDSNGELIGTAARNGKGPGELLAPASPRCIAIRLRYSIAICPQCSAGRSTTSQS